MIKNGALVDFNCIKKHVWWPLMTWSQIQLWIMLSVIFIAKTNSPALVTGCDIIGSRFGKIDFASLIFELSQFNWLSKTILNGDVFLETGLSTKFLLTISNPSSRDYRYFNWKADKEIILFCGIDNTSSKDWNISFWTVFFLPRILFLTNIWNDEIKWLVHFLCSKPGLPSMYTVDVLRTVR